MDPWEPLGRALMDYQCGNESAVVKIYNDLGEPDETPVVHFFREPENFPPAETTALSVVKGRVLDIGAGAGCHTIALQELGYDVTALDVCPSAVDVLKLRGVKDALCGKFTDLNVDVTGKFDTLLMMMNGIGIVGDLKGLEEFFVHAEKFVEDDGILVFDSIDLRESLMDEEIEGRLAVPWRGYYGETKYQFEYGGIRGPDFTWLFIDPDKLLEIALKCGWESGGIYTFDEGCYLSILSLTK